MRILRQHLYLLHLHPFLLPPPDFSYLIFLYPPLSPPFITSFCASKYSAISSFPDSDLCFLKVTDFLCSVSDSLPSCMIQNIPQDRKPKWNLRLSHFPTLRLMSALFIVQFLKTPHLLVADGMKLSLFFVTSEGQQQESYNSFSHVFLNYLDSTNLQSLNLPTL